MKKKNGWGMHASLSLTNSKHFKVWFFFFFLGGGGVLDFLISKKAIALKGTSQSGVPKVQKMYTIPREGERERENTYKQFRPRK